jgi:D-glycero-D-manno-heptose 1,7-bisphosphate phosphatase
MHRKLRRLVARAGGRVDRIVICPHAPDAGCDCRKPKPGLLLRIARFYRADLSGVPVIGDSLRDLRAATSIGARPILVRSGNGRETEAALPADLRGVDVFDDLRAAARALIAEVSP